MRVRAWRLGVVIALAGLCPIGAQPSAPAAVPAHDTFWHAVDAAERVRPCAAPSDIEAARRRLVAFDAYLSSLDDDAPAPLARDRLHALLRSRCFNFAFESPRIPWPTSVAALKDWFAEGGGAWLDSYLELPELGTLPDLAPHVVVPPDPRPTLVPGTGPQPRVLDRWVCLPADAACGLATRGWVTRAMLAIDQHARAAAGGRHWLSADDADDRTPEATSARCAREARDDGGYPRFRTCLENARPRRSLVPLGRFRAPDRGWLVVAGRRGHYSFCDTVSAYDLATGAAFIDESCSALALERDGSVDVDRTNMARRHSTRAGRLTVEHVREAAWMLLFRSQFPTGTPSLATFPLPADLVREWPAGMSVDPFDATLYGTTFSTAQTSLTWALVGGPGPVVAGQVTWPASSDAAEDHAVNLLTIAESGEVAGCRGALPPATVPAPAAFVDAWVDANDAVSLRERFTPAHRAWAALPACRR